jgi:hypothetical protein
MTFYRGNLTGRRLAPEWVFHPPRYGDSRPRLRLRRRRRRKCRSAGMTAWSCGVVTIR